jgi:hypothetical protein
VDDAVMRYVLWCRALLKELNRPVNKQVSQENWIPEAVRLQMLRRSLHLATNQAKEAAMVHAAVERELRVYNRDELAVAKAEERLGTQKKQECGLCLYKFSHVNLTLNVSIKAIIDLRKR